MMKSLGLSILYVVISVSAYSQAIIDSVLAVLSPDDPIVFNEQLYKIVDHGVFRRIDRDEHTWPDLTVSIANKAIAKVKNYPPSFQAITQAHFAEVLSRSKRIGKAYELMNNAMKLADKSPPFAKAYVYYRSADTFKNLYRLDSALFYAEQVLDISRDMGSDSLEKQSLSQVSMMYYEMRNNERAEFYLKKLVNNPLLSGLEKRGQYNTIGLTFMRRKLYDSAIFYFKKALANTPREDLAWVGLLNGNIGYTHYLQGHYDTALKGLLVDLDLSTRSRSTNSAMNALVSVTSIYILKKNAAVAKMYYDSLSHQVKRTGDREHYLEFLKISADYHSMRGDHTKSVDLLKAYIALNDSLVAVRNYDEGVKLQIQFDLNRQIKQIETLEMQTKLSAEENQRKNYLLGGTFALVVLGAGLAVVQFRSNRFKNHTNKLLKEQNKKITEQSARLNDLNQTKDKLFSIISHDIRGPINSLKGLMGMVKKQMVTQDEFHHFSAQLHDNVEHVHFTLDNLLHWSKAQMLGMQVKATAVDVGRLAQENVNLLAEPCKKKNIAVYNSIPDHLLVFADADQVRLVFRNLLSNALKFTNAGGEIFLTAAENDDHVTIEVRDTGIGMSAETLDKLFQENSSFSSAGTDGEKGTGLGLALCKEMVEYNKGVITIVSKEGMGTSFFVRLPRCP